MPANKLPPSVKAGLFGEHFIKFRRRPTEFLTELAKLGDITYMRIHRRPAYFLNHPDLIRDLLITNSDKFEKSRGLKRSKDLLGEGLLTSEGEKHLRQRRMIQPAFHKSRIIEYAKVMIDSAVSMRDKWKADEMREIDKEMMHLTLRIVGKALFSANVEDETDKVGKAITNLIERTDVIIPFSELLEKLPLPHSLRLKESRRILDHVVYEMINKRRQSGEDRGDLLSMLLMAQEDTGGVMSAKQIRDEALTLLVAGHETTANALTFTWYLLSQNPEKEAKLHEELDRILDGETLTVESISKLKYTEAVFAESIRLFPPAWAIGRLSIEEHRFGEYEVPKGALVLVSPFITQRDQRFWEKPNEFIPERWFKQSIKEAGQKFTFFPFNRGIRSCIGENFAWMEGILLLATISQRWKLRLHFDQKIEINPFMTLRPKYGMKMIVEKRHSLVNRN